MLRSVILVRIIYFRRIPRTGKQRVLPPHRHALHVSAVNKRSAFRGMTPILPRNQNRYLRAMTREEHVRFVIFGVFTVVEHAEVSRDAVTVAPDRAELRCVLHEQRALPRLRSVCFQ